MCPKTMIMMMMIMRMLRTAMAQLPQQQQEQQKPEDFHPRNLRGGRRRMNNSMSHRSAASRRSDAKKPICHRRGNGTYRLIRLPKRSYKAHLKHGDAPPGANIPGMDGYKFGDKCELSRFLAVALAAPYGKTLMAMASKTSLNPRWKVWSSLFIPKMVWYLCRKQPLVKMDNTALLVYSKVFTTCPLMPTHTTFLTQAITHLLPILSVSRQATLPRRSPPCLFMHLHL